MILKLKHFTFLIAASAALVACGGGGGGDDGPAVAELAPFAGNYSVRVLGGSSHTKYQNRAGDTVSLTISGSTVSVDGQAFTWDGVGDAVTATQSIGANPQPMTNIRVNGPNNSFISVDFTQSKGLAATILYQPVLAASLFGGFATFIP